VATAAKGRSSVGCVSRRSFVIHLPKRLRGRRVVSARVSVNGRSARPVRGRTLRTRISLKGVRKGRARVRIVSRLTNGRHVTTLRTYRTCAAPKRS
jgi:hypothetical protein